MTDDDTQRRSVPYRGALTLVLALACGPSVGTGDGSHSGDTTTTVPDDPTTTEVGGDPSADATSANPSTGEIPDDACILADPLACPDACRRDDVLEVIDDACNTDSVEACVAGGPKPGVPPTTWWTMAATGPVFLEYGGDACGAAAQPGDDWRECSGAADEPADCACFCQQGYCRGDNDRRVLDACELPSPCPVVFVEGELGAVDHAAETCVLEALRDRVPGVYEITTSYGFSSNSVRYYVFGEVVGFLLLEASDVITCPLVSEWGPASSCLLQPVAYFAGCLDSPEPACVITPQAWVLDCSPGAPDCG